MRQVADMGRRIGCLILIAGVVVAGTPAAWSCIQVGGAEVDCCCPAHGSAEAGPERGAQMKRHCPCVEPGQRDPDGTAPPAAVTSPESPRAVPAGHILARAVRDARPVAAAAPVHPRALSPPPSLLEQRTSFLR